MRLGPRLRRIEIKMEHIIRRFFLILDYIMWLIFDPSKFSRRPKKIKRVLVIDVGAYGDCLNTFCITDKLKNSYKNIEFYFLTSSKFYEEIKDYKKIKAIAYTKDKELLKKLRGYCFDVLINVHSGDIRPFDLRFVKYRVGNETEGILQVLCLRKILLSRKIFPTYDHKIKDRFRIFELAGFRFNNYNLNLGIISQKYKKEAEELTKIAGLNREDRIIFFNPAAGTSARARREGKTPSHDWPLERFSELADLILKEKGVKILVTGTKNDEFLAKTIIKGVKDKGRIKSICGKSSFFGLGELMKTFKEKGCVISIDTGTVHLATAVGIQVIDLMGPYDPELYCAWNPAKSLNDSKAITIFHDTWDSKSRKYYSPEERSFCMEAIDVDEVYETYRVITKNL